MAAGTLPAGARDSAPDPVRIVAFGTSLTASNPWPDGLQARLGACLGRPVTVHRVARNGMGSAWGLAQTNRVIALAPDIVLIEFAINDADILDGVWRTVSRDTHAALLDALEAGLPDAQLVLMTMNPVAGPLRRLQRPRLEAYYRMVRDLAAARGLTLVDLTPHWREAWASDPALRPEDGLHPGGAATARVVLPVLTAAVAALLGPDPGSGCAPAEPVTPQ